VRVAVTGATGFVGRHLVEALRQRGDAVRALARRPAPALVEAGVEIVPGTLADAPALQRLVEGAEVVHHLAGAIAARSEADFMRVNRDGTAHLAEAARAAGVQRFVYVSSLAVTGPTVAGRSLDESGPPRPISAYGRSKQAGEEATARSGVRFTIVRPPAVYGPHDKALLLFFRLACRGIAPVFGDGRQELNVVFASDLARALLAAAASDAAEGRTYHAAHPIATTQLAIVQAIAAAVGRRVTHVRLSAPMVRSLFALSGVLARLAGRVTPLDRDRARALLAPAWLCRSEALARDAGWRAEMDLREGLERTARWYREAGWLAGGPGGAAHAAP
jgi:nucleoside-diphosphate-sugar epimerase